MLFYNLDELSYYEKSQIALSQNSLTNTNEIDIFLQKLDDFNLNEYIKAIHFYESKVPNVPFFKYSSKTYYGTKNLTEKFLNKTKNYSYEINLNNTFRKIQITILKNICVIIFKNLKPSIHFVIKHPLNYEIQ